MNFKKFVRYNHEGLLIKHVEPNHATRFVRYNLQPCICYNRDRFNRVQLYIMYGQLLSHKMVVTNLLQLLMTIISNQTNTDIFVTRLLIVFVFLSYPQVHCSAELFLQSNLKSPVHVPAICQQGMETKVFLLKHIGFVCILFIGDQ